MKIAAALQVQKALSAEIAHLRELEGEKAWSFRSIRGGEQHPDAEWTPNFDFEKNHETVLRLTKLHTRLSQAISRTNLEVDIVGIEDTDFKDWA